MAQNRPVNLFLPCPWQSQFSRYTAIGRGKTSPSVCIYSELHKLARRLLCIRSVDGRSGLPFRLMFAVQMFGFIRVNCLGNLTRFPSFARGFRAVLALSIRRCSVCSPDFIYLRAVLDCGIVCRSRRCHFHLVPVKSHRIQNAPERPRLPGEVD